MGIIYVQDPSNISSLAVTDPGAAVAGDIVRGTGVAGTFTPAQADTSAHAASVAGIYDGSVVRPLQGVMLCKFDALPVVHAPAYLSATVAGKFSPTAGALGLNAFGVVSRVVSAVSPYTAEVNFGRTTESCQQLGLREQILADASAWDGGSGGQWDVSLIEDFGALYGTALVQYGTTAVDGAATIAQSGTSSVLFDGTAGHASWTVLKLLAGPINSEKWWLRFRVKITDENVYGTIFLYDSARHVGIGFRHADPNQFNTMQGAGDPGGTGGISIGAFDENYHTFDLRCDGLNLTSSIEARMDGGAWVAVTTTVSAGTNTNLRIMAYGTTILVDHLEFARKVSRA